MKIKLTLDFNSKIVDVSNERDYNKAVIKFLRGYQYKLIESYCNKNKKTKNKTIFEKRRIVLNLIKTVKLQNRGIPAFIYKIDSTMEMENMITTQVEINGIFENPRFMLIGYNTSKNTEFELCSRAINLVIDCDKALEGLISSKFLTKQELKLIQQ